MTSITMIDRRRSKDYIQMNIYLKREIHKKLKLAAIEDELTMSEFMEKLAIEALEKRGNL